MSGKAQVARLLMDREEVAWRPSQLYSHDVGGGVYTIFTINNGPVEIKSLGGIVRAAATDAVEVDITVNTIHTDAAAVAINGAVGLVFLSTLNVAGTLVQAAGIPKTVALLHPLGFIAGIQAAGPGLIVATFTVGHFTGEWFCVYRRLSPQAVIT